MTTRHPDHGRATTALLALTILWGSTFVVLQSSLELFSPFVLIGLRFTIAGLLIALVRRTAVREAFQVLKVALPLSLSLFFGFALQTVGLQSTTPARSAFLTSLSVVVVPLFEILLLQRRPPARMLLAVAMAAAGVWLLFLPFRLEWRLGDTLTLCGAAFFGFYVVELGRRSRAHSAAALVIAQFSTMAALAFGAVLLFETPRLSSSPQALLGLGYLSLVCTVLTFLLMTWAQARVEATRAGIIYTLEPVVAALLSIGLGREPSSWKVVAGGACVLAATLVASSGEHPTPAAPPEGID